MTVLIIGGSGFLGTELLRQARSTGLSTAATFNSRPGELPGTTWHHLDFHDLRRLDAVLDAVRPSVVINSSSGNSDWAVTADGPGHLARGAAMRGIRFVHVSSDAVFSGNRGSGYDETAFPDPVTPYGAAKGAAETAVRLLDPAAVIARTSLIIGNSGSSHERVVHELAAGTRTGALFTDDVRCPVHVADLAAALLELTHGVRRGWHRSSRGGRGPDPLARRAYRPA